MARVVMFVAAIALIAVTFDRRDGHERAASGGMYGSTMSATPLFEELFDVVALE